MQNVDKLQLPDAQLEFLRGIEHKRQQEVLQTVKSVHDQAETDIAKIKRDYRKGTELREKVGPATKAVHEAADKLAEQTASNMACLSGITQNAFGSFADQVDMRMNEADSLAAHAKSQAVAIKAQLCKVLALHKQLDERHVQVNRKLILHEDFALKSDTKLDDLWQEEIENCIALPVSERTATHLSEVDSACACEVKASSSSSSPSEF